MTAAAQVVTEASRVAGAPASVARSAPPRAGRLPGVDGLRAVAALWVVLFHMRAFSGATLHGIPGLDLFVRSGSTGVSLFLVLSGFCLYIPFAGGRADRFNARGFLRRRVKRLYPAYAVSLVVTLAIMLASGAAIGLAQPGPAGAVGQFLAHLGMVHTLLPSTFYAVNGAYWSLGLEWQLYITLPLLVAVIRRRGLAVTVAGVVAVNVLYRLVVDALVRHGVASGLTASAVLPNVFLGRWAEFAFGMVAADLYARRRLGSWTTVAGILGAAAVPVAVWIQGGALEHILFGGVFFCLLVVVLHGSTAVSRVAAWRPLAALGTMSYSLYLVHQPIVQSLGWVIRSHGIGPQSTFGVLLLATPLVIGVALVLFLTVERRTLTARRTGADAGAAAAAPYHARAGLPHPVGGDVPA